MKAWYESKIVWAAVALSAISILQLFSAWYTKGDFSVPGCVELAIGALLIVVRVWFTDQPIDTPKARAKYAFLDEDDEPESGRRGKKKRYYN